MEIARIILIFNESRQGAIPGDGIMLSHRLSFTDSDRRITARIVRHRAAQQSVRDVEYKQIRSKGFVAWIWQTALTFYRDKEQSLQRQILLAITRRLENRHPVELGLRYSENNNHEQAIDLPHKAANLAELIKKGKHFHFYIEWIPSKLVGGLRDY